METTNDPKSFAFRLRHTITQLEQETAAGIENWAPTIDRLKATLAEVEKEESDTCSFPCAACDNADDYFDAEDRRMEAESDDLSWEADENRRMESL